MRRLGLNLLLFIVFALSANAGEDNSSISEATQPLDGTETYKAPAPMGVHGADMPSKGKLTLTAMPVFDNHSGWLIGTKGVSLSLIHI